MRFHIGMSFNPKKLIKWILFVLFGIFGFKFIDVFAAESLTNYDTSYDFIYSPVNFDSIQISSEYTMQDIFDMYVGYDSDYYDITLTYNVTSPTISILLVPKSYTFKSFKFVGSDHVGTSSTYVGTNQQIVSSGYSLYLSQSNNSIESLITKVNSCLDNDVCTGLSSGPSIWTYLHTSEDLSNDSSYTFDLSTYTGNYLYYTQSSLIYSKSSDRNPNASYIDYYKSVSFNGNILNDQDSILTYCDIYNCDGSSTVDWKIYPFDKFGDIFVSNIPKDDLSNIKIDFNFNFYDQNFVNDLKFQTLLYGRKNNTTYYSYELLEDCKLFSNIAKGSNDISYTFTGLSCSKSLKNYDNIYVQLRPYNYDRTSNINIYNPTIQTNYGFIDHIENGSAHFTLMEHFSNLPNNFNMILSTKNNFSHASFHANHNNVLMSNINRSDNHINQVGSSQIATFGHEDSTNLIIYNYTSKYSDLTNLNLFFHYNSILSYNANNLFSFYDSNNNLVDSNIVNNLQEDNSSTSDFSILKGLDSIIPSGPIDSVLVIPVNFLRKSINALNGSCSPLKATFVFDQELELPCFDLYSSFPPFLMIFIDTIPCAFISVKYLKHLTKQVDRVTNLETNSDDEWGVL